MAGTHVPRWLAAATSVLLLVLRATAGDLPASSPEPLKLTIAVNDIYGKETACTCVQQVASREYGDLIEALKTRHGVTLEFVYFSEPYQLDRALREGRFDGALCKPWLALRHSGPSTRTYRRIADLQDPNGNTQLRGDVIVLRESPLRAARDLKGRRVAIGHDESYEKSHAAFALLKREGITLPPGNLVRKASCLEAIDLLLQGKVDAAVISDYTLTADCAVDILKPEQVRVIASTEKVPLTSLLVDVNRVPAAVAERLSRALLDLSRTALPESMQGGGFVAAQPWTPAELEGAKQ